MKRILEFDRTTGLIVAEAGLTIADLVQAALGDGEKDLLFPAVIPGATSVTIGGAIANDVHGKNHATEGSFCHHVEALTLLRSDGSVLACNKHENCELFQATLGGLGLTGIILSATLRLRPVPGCLLETENLRFRHLEEAFALFESSVSDWEYRSFWFNPFDPHGSGTFVRSRHSGATMRAAARSGLRRLARLPFPTTLGGPHFWRAYYALLATRARPLRSGCSNYRAALAPLGEFPNWNRLLGPRGLVHVQGVFPKAAARALLQTLLDDCRAAGEPPCLASVKLFGPHPRAGILSFPREGVTAALDFSHRGESTTKLVQRVQRRILDADGAVYPGKDSTLDPDGFRRSFPDWQAFSRHVDPRFSSSFWRRVSGEPS